ncbi:MAG: hypothetical protein ABI539_12375 [Acidobacteriota bacterium]
MSKPVYVLGVSGKYNQSGSADAHHPAAALLRDGEIVPYLIVVYWLTSSYGIVGAAIAWSMRVAFDGIAFFVLAKRNASVGLQLKGGKIALVSFGVFLYVPLVLDLVLSGGSMSITSIVLFLIATLSYSVIVWRGILSSSEKNWLLSMARI